jgi:hypothetical protein
MLKPIQTIASKFYIYQNDTELENLQKSVAQEAFFDHIEVDDSP